ncbi:transcriptional protein SWT1 [Polyergus mexicanus]|uniref:transcriptional protein SWT1 n=1 Tax=Polyergus mexicanus TaxID=615972 RepID=UPI0038B4B00A
MLKMMKQKLPTNWITVGSKSHPDRVYYFNVKTNQSSWTEPALDETNKTNNKKRKRRRKKRESQTTITPEHNLVDDETVSKQQTSDKTKETPQMKAIREKMLQKLTAKNKSSLSSSKTSAKLTESETVSSLKKTKLVKNDESMKSLDKNDNKITTFTPQMSVLYEKIQQRNLNKSNPDKKLKMNIKSKQQDLNITNQVSMKVQENQEKSTGHQETMNRNKNNVEQCSNNKIQNAQKSHNQNISKKKEPNLLPKKNIAKERMRVLRKSLSSDKEKLKEIGRAIINEKEAPQKLSKRLSSNNHSLESTCVYKNVEVRLTRLHNKILKDVKYKNSITLNNDKSQIRQNNEPVVDNMTKEKLIEQAKQEILYEEMDWEPINDDDITLEVEVVRTQLGKKNHVDKINYISGNTVELIQHNRTEPQEKSPLYIVVDTNVFLSNLKIIEEARDATFKNYPRPFIVIPWTVIHELDYIKNNKSTHEICIKARKAISFIHEQFSSKHPRIIGQTREQAAKNKEDFSLTCPDDEILQCCLQICQLQKSVVLLSYDKNLCNKAMVYNILALGRNDPLEKIDYYDVNDKIVNHLNNDPIEESVFNNELHFTDDIFENTKATMKNFLSTIIIKQMSEIYGEAEWKLYVIIKPPWTIVTALKCAIKHWIAAINESFQRCAEYILKELLQGFEYLPVGGRKLEDVEYILEKCSDLVQVVNADKYYELMTQTFDAIMELKKKCRNYIINIQQKRLHDKIGIAEDIKEQEMRAGKVFQCFQHIYNYARDICGTACSNAGMAHSFNFEPSSLLPATIEYLRPELTKKVVDLTQNLSKLLLQAENSNVKYPTLINLQQNLNTFLPDIEYKTFDVTVLDVYYCIKLKEEPLKTGLKQLQELTTHFCALAVHT